MMKTPLKRKEGAAINLHDDINMLDNALVIQAIVKADREKYDRIKRRKYKITDIFKKPNRIIGKRKHV